MEKPEHVAEASACLNDNTGNVCGRHIL